MNERQELSEPNRHSRGGRGGRVRDGNVSSRGGPERLRSLHAGARRYSLFLICCSRPPKFRGRYVKIPPRRGGAR